MGEFDAIHAELEAEFGRPGPAPTLPELDAFKSVAADARGRDGRLKSLSTPVRTAIVVVVCLAIPALAAWLTPRRDFDVYPMARMLAFSALHIGALAAAAWASMRALTTLRPGRPRAPFAVALVVVGLFALLLLGPAHLDHPASLKGNGDDFGARAMMCFVFGGIIGVLPLVFSRTFDRSSAAWLGQGLLLGTLSAGLAGNLYLLWHCPIVWPAHIAAGHLSVLGFYLLIAGLLGRAGSSDIS